MNATKRFSFPSPYTVLVIVIALAAAATWLLPAGTYTRLAYDEAAASFTLEDPTGTRVVPATQATLDSLGIAIPLEKFTDGDIRRAVAVPGTYTEVDTARQGLLAILQAPIRGLYDAIDVVLFVLVIGGFIEVFGRTGAFEAGINALAQGLRGRESWLIIILTTLFALGGTTFGMAEETIAFYPILVPVFIAAGYDRIVPLAVIFVGAGMGFMASTVNPFATIIASDAAGISWTAGIIGRMVMLVVGTTICIAYTIRYANRVRADPSTSLAPPLPTGETVPALAGAADAATPPAVTARIRLLLGLFAVIFAIMIWGVSRMGWWFLEMTTLFLASAIIVGIIRRGGEKRFVNDFVRGAESLLGVALIIGIARGATLVMDDGQISGTLLAYASTAVSGMPPALFIVALMLVYFGLAIFIASSSGMAVLTMPIMGALAPVAGVPSEQIVNAYLYGFGLMMFITPVGMILPSLAMVNVSYGAWLRWVTPLLGLLGIVAAIALVAGVAVG